MSYSMGSGLTERIGAYGTGGTSGAAAGATLLFRHPGCIEITVIFGEKVAIDQQRVRDERVRERKGELEDADAVAEILLGNGGGAGFALDEAERNVSLADLERTGVKGRLCECKRLPGSREAVVAMAGETACVGVG